METAGHKQRIGREGLQLAPSALTLRLEVGLRWEWGDPGGCLQAVGAGTPSWLPRCCLQAARAGLRRLYTGQIAWFSFSISIRCPGTFASPKPTAAHAAAAPDSFFCQGRAAVLVAATGVLALAPGPTTPPLTSHPCPQTLSPIITLHMNHFLMFGLIHTDSLNNKKKSANSITIWKSLS